MKSSTHKGDSVFQGSDVLRKPSTAKQTHLENNRTKIQLIKLPAKSMTYHGTELVHVFNGSS